MEGGIYQMWWKIAVMNLAKNGGFRLCPPFSFLVDELEVGDNIPVEEVLEVDFEIERAVVLVWVFWPLELEELVAEWDVEAKYDILELAAVENMLPPETILSYVDQVLE